MRVLPPSAKKRLKEQNEEQREEQREAAECSGKGSSFSWILELAVVKGFVVSGSSFLWSDGVKSHI